MVKLEINVTCLCYGRLCVTYHPHLIRCDYVLNRLSIKFPWGELKVGHLIGSGDLYWEESCTCLTQNYYARKLTADGLSWWWTLPEAGIAESWGLMHLWRGDRLTGDGCGCRRRVCTEKANREEAFDFRFSRKKKLLKQVLDHGESRKNQAEHSCKC